MICPGALCCPEDVQELGIKMCINSVCESSPAISSCTQLAMSMLESWVSSISWIVLTIGSPYQVAHAQAMCSCSVSECAPLVPVEHLASASLFAGSAASRLGRAGDAAADAQLWSVSSSLRTHVQRVCCCSVARSAKPPRRRHRVLDRHQATTQAARLL